jgi:hypothetical protein
MHGRGLALLFVAAAFGCTRDPGMRVSTTAPGFLKIHEQILVPSCTSSACHDGERGIAGLTFSDPRRAYDLLVGVEPTNGAARTDGLLRVAAGDPNRSLLLWKLNHSTGELNELGYGAAMPLGGSSAPGVMSVEAIRAWIADGAPWDGIDFTADTRTVVNGYVSCDATDEAGMRACFGPDPDPTRYMRLFTPPITLAPGEDQTICTYLDVTTTETLLFRATRGRQMLGGHHIAVFYAQRPTTDFTPHVCTNEEMSNFMFAAGAGGEGGQDTAMPPGVALRIEAGRQIVIQSHYLNTSPMPRTVMDMVDIELTTIEASPMVVDSFAMISSDFSVPPRSRDFESVKECRIDQEMDIYLLLGHTHENGVLFQFERLPAGGGPAEMLYRATDGPLLRDNPQILTYDTPLHFGVGDTLRMTCRWDNMTETPLEWPSEMCVALMYYGPGRGWVTCDSGDATPNWRDPADMGCAIPTDYGNSLGVGRYCEGAADCRDNGPSTLCLAPFDAASNFCSFIGCTMDSECGENATCVIQTAGSACVPNHCLGP